MSHEENGQLLVCDICGKKRARVRKLTEAYGKRKDLLIIEDIPMVSCPNCGERYFTADTLHEIERIKLHRDGFAAEKAVEVASIKSLDFRMIFR